MIWSMKQTLKHIESIVILLFIIYIKLNKYKYKHIKLLQIVIVAF